MVGTIDEAACQGRKMKGAPNHENASEAIELVVVTPERQLLREKPSRCNCRGRRLSRRTTGERTAHHELGSANSATTIPCKESAISPLFADLPKFFRIR